MKVKSLVGAFSVIVKPASEYLSRPGPAWVRTALSTCWCRLTRDTPGPSSSGTPRDVTSLFWQGLCFFLQSSLQTPPCDFDICGGVWWLVTTKFTGSSILAWPFAWASKNKKYHLLQRYLGRGLKFTLYSPFILNHYTSPPLAQSIVFTLLLITGDRALT